nr:MAG TPA: hypothetical protein [Caudoviricetes sp.]
MDNKEKTLQERILLGMACEINCTHDMLHKYAAAISHCDDVDSQKFLADEAIAKCFDLIRTMEDIIHNYDDRE